MLTDIEIAKSNKKCHISEIAKMIGLGIDDIDFYGKYKAKLPLEILNKNQKAKLVLVTAITPTKMGEGKTTTSIGLADGLKKIGKNVICVLREPSLGPVFGLKGGAAGGGYSQVVPMEDINLHFTGDFHAISAANNLISAMLDNHIFQGNSLNINPDKIVHRRVVDMNDRQLRFITSGQGGEKNGVEHKDGFDITVASEVMAIFCLASDFSDLKIRIGKMIVAYDMNDNPITVNDIKATGAVTTLLYDAIKPNLVQTLEHTPTIIHGGPFANIAHGCNSVIATKIGMRLADIVVTEAGFGADLGAEKFFDIKCRSANIKPDAVVLVATVRALKLHGGDLFDNLKNENLDAVIKGMPNLLQHISNIKNVYGLPVVVAVNKFPTDTENELNIIIDKCKELGVEVSLSEGYSRGGDGTVELANKVVKLFNEKNEFKFCYDLEDSIFDKLSKVATKIYHADGIELTDEAKRQLEVLNKLGYNKLPICIAKTQYSFSDNPKLLSAPKGFNITIRNLKISAGAGFVVALTGDIMTMPGLPKVPAAESIDIDEKGEITGLF